MNTVDLLSNATADSLVTENAWFTTENPVQSTLTSLLSTLLKSTLYPSRDEINDYKILKPVDGDNSSKNSMTSGQRALLIFCAFALVALIAFVVMRNRRKPWLNFRMNRLFHSQANGSRGQDDEIAFGCQGEQPSLRDGYEKMPFSGATGTIPSNNHDIADVGYNSMQGRLTIAM